MKNYIGIVRDHSGSMSSLARTAAKDYNTTINAIKEAAIREGQDTIVSVTRFSGRMGNRVVRESVNSSISALRPMAEGDYDTGGGTPLYDSVGDMIEQLSTVPDAKDPSVSFVIMAITDGEELSSIKYSAGSLSAKIRELQKTDRWTFVFRVPGGFRTKLARQLGLHEGNVQEWEGTTEGLTLATLQTKTAVDTFYNARSRGATMTKSFYTPDLNGVSTKEIKKSLPDVTSQVKFFDIGARDNKRQIRDFVEEKTKQTLPIGAAFYQLTKKENEVQPSKLLAVRDKRTGHVFSSTAARDVLGIPHTGTVKLVPGDHGNFDIFVQSKSVNRNLISGTQVMYWPNAGRGV